MMERVKREQEEERRVAEMRMSAGLAGCGGCRTPHPSPREYPVRAYVENIEHDLACKLVRLVFYLPLSLACSFLWRIF